MPDASAALIENAGLRVKACRHGLMAYPVNDTFVGRSLDLYGEWSPGDAAVLAPYLAPGMTVVDAGANIGTHSLFFAAAVGIAGAVLAFEPVPVSYRLLCCNLALNGAHHVRAFPLGLSRHGGQATAPELSLDGPGNFGAASLAKQGLGEVVNLATLDDFDLPGCDLIKADVEGMEQEVIAGAARTVARFRPILFLENEEPSLSAGLIAPLLVLGYRLFWHSPPLFDPDNFFANPVDVFSGYGSLNLLGLPAERELPVPSGLKPVEGANDWPAWWPDWSAQG